MATPQDHTPAVKAGATTRTPVEAELSPLGVPASPASFWLRQADAVISFLALEAGA